MSDPFIAEVKIFAGNFAPRGWSFCNGQLLPIAQNTALFSIVGTTFGGDGRTTMGIPNLQGRAALHPGRGPGLTQRRWGEQGGVENVTLSEAQLPSHTHQLGASTAATDEEGTSNPADAVTGETENSARLYAPAASADGTLAASALPNVGGGGAHSNRPPYLAMYFIIALVGTYPSRS